MEKRKKGEKEKGEKRYAVCGVRYEVCGMRYAVCGMRYEV
jgi:hypothetical protein